MNMTEVNIFLKEYKKSLKLFPLFKTKIEKPFIKPFTNKKLLRELTFYDKPTITKNDEVYRLSKTHQPN